MRTLALAIALLLLPASAAGAASAGARHSKVTLAACDTEAKSATFRASMRTVRRAPGLQLRFTLQARVPGGGGFKRVVAPGLDTWLSSTPGKKRYVYDKTVEPLATRTAYRAVVRFRWKDATGDVIARASKVSRACWQPDERPNLKVKSITAGAGASPSMRSYRVRVVNRGATESPAFSTGFSVGDAALPEQIAGPLAPRKSTVVEFEGPQCAPGSTVTAAVDTLAAVDERDEGDNALAVPCPVGARRNAPAAA